MLAIQLYDDKSSIGDHIMRTIAMLNPTFKIKNSYKLEIRS
jgi:hypothetical protein